jgi:hypothetical protein
MRVSLLACSAAQLLMAAYLSWSPVEAQAAPPAAAPVAPPTLPPATKLEAFKPAAGSVLTIGYSELGNVSGVSVDIREMRDASGNTVRGLVVEVTESQYRRERSFVDADEIPELLRGVDALLEVKANPTRFKNFEVRYTTRGEVQLTAFNNAQGDIRYAVEAGRTLKAQRFLDAEGLRKLRGMVQTASRNPAPAQGSVNAAEPSTGLGDQVPPGMKWVADSKARRYYAIGCPAAAKIAAADRLYYGEESALQAAGFKRAEGC